MLVTSTYGQIETTTALTQRDCTVFGWYYNYITNSKIYFRKYIGFLSYNNEREGRDNVVGMAACYGLDGMEIQS